MGRLHRSRGDEVSLPHRAGVRNTEASPAGRRRCRHRRSHHRSDGRTRSGQHSARRLLQPRRHRVSGLRPGVRQSRAQSRRSTLARDGVALAGTVRGTQRLHRAGEGRLQASRRVLRVPLSARGECVRRGDPGGRRRQDRLRCRELVQDGQSDGDRSGGPQGIRRRHPANGDRGHSPQQVHGADEGRRAARRLDGLDQHLRGRDLRPFERRPRRVGQGRLAEVPRLLGAARKEPHADEAARAGSDGDAHAGREDRQEQRGAPLQPAR